MAKTPEEKEAEKKAKQEAAAKAEAELEKEAPDIKAESDRITAEKIAKEEAKRKEFESREGTDKQERKYSEAEVQAMLKQFAKNIKSGESDEEDLDEIDPFEQKKVRIPRFVDATGKVQFVFDFQNTNNDPYFPDSVVKAFDVWNDQTKRNDPWVTLIYQHKTGIDKDGKEVSTSMNIPLHTVIKKSSKVECDLIEVIETDKSYSAGKTERAAPVGAGDYSTKGTGQMVKMKVTMADYVYKIRLPDGKEAIVSKDVINWA